MMIESRAFDLDVRWMLVKTPCRKKRGAPLGKGDKCRDFGNVRRAHVSPGAWDSYPAAPLRLRLTTRIVPVIQIRV